MILDVLVYLTPRHRARVLRAVAARCAAARDAAIARAPGFGGARNARVALVGHSLGSVICFDLLSARALGFTPAALVALGSPIAVFVSVAGDEPAVAVERARGDRAPPAARVGDASFFNVYHPNDPVAFRLDPVLLAPALGARADAADALAARPAALVPHARRSDGLRWHRRLARDVMATAQRAGAGAPDAAELAPDEAAAALPRVDWQLQESATEALNEYVSAIASHGGYFESEDVACFIAECVADARPARNTSGAEDASEEEG